MNVVHDEGQSQTARDQPQDDQQDVVVAATTTTTTAATTIPRMMSDGTPPCKSSSQRKKKCSMPECTKQAKVGGLCMKHGGKVKYRFCRAMGCNNVTQKGGYCKRHYNDFCASDAAVDGGKKRRVE